MPLLHRIARKQPRHDRLHARRRGLRGPGRRHAADRDPQPGRRGCGGASSRGAPRAGFCLMGACQDCWVTLDRRRAPARLHHPSQPGMSIVTASGARGMSERAAAADRRRRPGRHPRGARRWSRPACARSWSTRRRPAAARSIASASCRTSAARRRSTASEAGKADRRCIATSQRWPDRIDYWPQALVWNLREGDRRYRRSPATNRRVAYDGLILATGATDRVLPIPGWTLPGVFTLGGAQVALKAQGCAIGQRVVFVGTGPLLYLVAWQYVKAGVEVAAVLDTAPFSAKLACCAACRCRRPSCCAACASSPSCALRGVALHYGVEDAAGSRATTRVTGVAWRERRRASTASPATPSATASRCARRPSSPISPAAASASIERDRAWLPRARRGRAHQRAAASTSPATAPASPAPMRPSGPASAPRWRCCEDRGLPSIAGARRGAGSASSPRIDRFRDVLEARLPLPGALGRRASPTTLLLCRCEEITRRRRSRGDRASSASTRSTA